MDSFFDNNKKHHFAVLGGGSWATALVKLLSENHKNISWYMRDINNIKYIRENYHSKRYLRSVHLDTSKFFMSDDITDVIMSSDIIVIAIPSAYFITELSKANCSFEDKFIISAVKGFVGKHNLTAAEYFNQEMSIPFDNIGIISGPCHAEEVSLEKLSYMTLSSKHMETAKALCDLFSCDYVHTIPGTDIYGVEYSAALKNIYALAAGICHGLGYGDNFMAVLITNAYNELVKFMNATYPESTRVPSTSAYLGDLLVTCYSQFSRNRTFGNMIGKGYSVISAQMEMNMVAEGYFAAKSIHNINKKCKVSLPIADAVYAILFENKYPPRVIHELCKALQ
ncbi:MAG: NAD(P)H-dependent glycerol-3-phosphate dehydrogenase [Bacteroidales bacterium]